MFFLELLLAASAWAQTRTALPPAAPAAVPAVELPAAAPLEAPPALPALPALEALPEAEAALPQPQAAPSEDGGSELERQDRAVEALLEKSPVEKSGEGEAYETGASLQRMLEGQDSAPALPALDVSGSAEAPALQALPESPEATAAELLRQVESRSARRALERKIYTDPLTGLLKRSWLYDHLGEVLRRSTTVMMVDLDHFKKGVNDRYGHDVGDIALAELAKIMQAERSGNRVNVRWGGEEFLILDKLNPAQAQAAAEKLRKSVLAGLAPAVQKQTQLRLARRVELWGMTASIGVAPLTRKTGDDVSDLLASIEQADKRLYDAKQAGRNQVQSSSTEEWPAANRKAELWNKILNLWKGAVAPRADAPIAQEVDRLLEQVQNPELRRRLSDKLYTDSLTRTRNRAHLNDHVEALVSRYRCILYVDVDRFKGVNDRYGHVRAGEILAHLGSILKEQGGEAVYVMGGEEFMILTEAPPVRALEQAETLRKAVEARLGAETGIETTTVSIGVSELDKTLSARDALQKAVTAADQALYQAKQKGRNRVVVSLP